MYNQQLMQMNNMYSSSNQSRPDKSATKIESPKSALAGKSGMKYGSQPPKALVEQHYAQVMAMQRSHKQ
jgi:hypothetical protein